MRKYLIRYLVFWLPALAASFMFKSAETVQLFFAFFMLFGWCVNSGMAAKLHARNTLSAILLYFGAGVLVMTFQYTGQLRFLGEYSRTITGIFSYVPAGVFMRRIIGYNIMHEIYIISGISAVCLLGWAAGALYKRSVFPCLKSSIS